MFRSEPRRNMQELDTKWKRERERKMAMRYKATTFLLRENYYKKQKKKSDLVILYVFYINKGTRTWVVIK
jgi:hypothetical protein